MAQPFIGQISIFAGNFAPVNYAFCSGQLMPISQNQALYTLIGTTYGGDGQTTFGLPDLRGRTPIHQGTGSTGTSYAIGELLGQETVTLLTQQMPVHTHSAMAAAIGTTDTPAGGYPATDPAGNVAQFKTGAADAVMSGGAIGLTGGGTAHNNIQPSLAVNFIIALFGVFPSQN